MTLSYDSCDSCGYELTGLSLIGRCPECGATIRPPSSHPDVRTERAAVARWTAIHRKSAVPLALASALALAVVVGFGLSATAPHKLPVLLIIAAIGAALAMLLLQEESWAPPELRLSLFLQNFSLISLLTIAMVLTQGANWEYWWGGAAMAYWGGLIVLYGRGADEHDDPQASSDSVRFSFAVCFIWVPITGWYILRGP